jgi:hypothetical protein
MLRGSNAFRFLFALWLLASALIAPAAGQNRELFTIDDYFRIVSFRIDDWTKDGRWLAGSISSQADRLAPDNYRYGDPTYIAPSVADLVVMDTRDGKPIRLFPQKEQVRGAAWSPDGKRLALFVYRKPAYQIMIWSRETKAFEKASFKSPKPIAANSSLVWAPDGTKLYLGLRPPDWETKSAELFKKATVAPIIQFDSEKPFLPWDEVGRRSRLIIPAVWEIAANKITELLRKLRSCRPGSSRTEPIGSSNGTSPKRRITTSSAARRTSSRSCRSRAVRRASCSSPTNSALSPGPKTTGYSPTPTRATSTSWASRTRNRGS